MIRSLRDEALELLEGRGAILKTARHVSGVLERAHVEAGVVGGMAVVLHGHIRATADVDVFVPGSLEAAAQALKARGYEFDARRREFRRGAVPVHLVSPGQARIAPAEFVTVDGVRTVSLADLINMKLDLGLREPLRAQDLADVIGLIRARRLAPTFASQLARGLRPEFRKLAKAVAKERGC